MIRFITDSASDITALEGVDFISVPLTISTDEREFIDDSSLDIHEMLDYLAAYKGRSYTACPSLDRWLTAYEGADEAYVITITSGLSGTYNSAVMARDMYLEDHPEAKIHVIDSLSTGPQERLLMEKIVELKAAGHSFEEVVEEITKYHHYTRLFWGFQSIHNLAENGRVNKLVASALGVLGINLYGIASAEGKVEPTGKCRGEKKLVKALIDMMKEAGYNGGRIRISHVENEALAQAFVTALQKVIPAADIRIDHTLGLCAYYVERGGIVVACEVEKEFYVNE